MTNNFRILVVDDEDSIRKRCVRLLSRQGYHVIGASSSLAALDLVQKEGEWFDLLLVDIRMPGMDGIHLMEKVKAQRQSIQVIIMTGHATVETAVKAMKKGAYDYLSKPFEMEELLHLVKKVVEIRSLQQEIKELRSQLKDSREPPFIFGNSEAMNRVMRFIEKVAPVDCNILIQGESGTGKGLAAKAIHARSRREDGPFVIADCAALSGTILESELFGHVKGAFTGAHVDREGYFQKADKGTLLLDEISEVPLDLQGKLLRAVQEQAVVKVGSAEPLRINARIIAATNRNLENLVAQGKFREDLFYRLNVVTLTMPALRDRREDIPLLARHFLKWYTARLNLDRVTLPDEIVAAVSIHDWPGNVRELENAIQRAVVMAENGVISLKDLFPSLLRKDSAPCNPSDPLHGKKSFQDMRREVVSNFTRQYLTRTLTDHNGNITQTAKAMGMRRTSLQRLIRQSGLNSRALKGLGNE
ncbi:MAG: sigma-54 dependent transcriptional regulator [Deltaproteobacteria bacterium]|nr:sigma-54 dependent transcriptional regulator [Deltaproteobacteria bacterium]